MGKSKKTNLKKHSVYRRDIVRRGLSTSRRLHDRKKTDFKYSSLDLIPVRVQTRNRKQVRKPIEPIQSDFQPRQINYGAFHAPININLKKEDFVCARRQIRREVIHATGKSGTRVRKPVYTKQSNIKCL